jgi:hypothetical protein
VVPHAQFATSFRATESGLVAHAQLASTTAIADASKLNGRERGGDQHQRFFPLAQAQSATLPMIANTETMTTP